MQENISYVNIVKQFEPSNLPIKLKGIMPTT